MDRREMIKKLEIVVQKRTPQYTKFNNPSFDEKLMKAHYLLAEIYASQGNSGEARSHLKEAEYEFINMCRVETQKSKDKYFSGKEGFRKLKEEERKTEKRLESYKGKLFDVADKIGYNTTNILFAPTSSSRTKKGLNELINESYA